LKNIALCGMLALASADDLPNLMYDVTPSADPNCCFPASLLNIANNIGFPFVEGFYANSTACIQANRTGLYQKFYFPSDNVDFKAVINGDTVVGVQSFVNSENCTTPVTPTTTVLDFSGTFDLIPNQNNDPRCCVPSVVTSLNNGSNLLFQGTFSNSDSCTQLNMTGDFNITTSPINLNDASGNKWYGAVNLILGFEVFGSSNYYFYEIFGNDSAFFFECNATGVKRDHNHIAISN